jgi:hypothetical protein
MIGIGVHRKCRSSTAPVIPELVSAVINDTSSAFITFNLPLNYAFYPDSSAFIMKINGEIVDSGYDGITIVNEPNDSLVFARSFSYGDIITVSYTAPLENPLQGVDGGLVASFVDYPVTNNIEAP